MDLKFIFCYSCVLFLLLKPCFSSEDDGYLLHRALDALTRALHYAQENVDEINLDAVFCIRRVQEQLDSYLTFQPKVFRDVFQWVSVLRDKAKKIADEATHFIYVADPTYAAAVGAMTNESKKIAWYPSLSTSAEYVVEPVSCADYYYDVFKQNTCYHLLMGGSSGVSCRVTLDCNVFNSHWNQRLYALTHQILYWEAMEAQKCVDEISETRRMLFCSNIMREANLTAAAQFPTSHADLFMEQVGLCGIWGFRDFNKPEWLEKILDWQEPSGCYRHYQQSFCFDSVPIEAHNIVKRREEKLKDGCLSHKTAVAMLALVVNVRFEAEKAHERMNGLSKEELNTLLNGMQSSFFEINENEL